MDDPNRFNGLDWDAYDRVVRAKGPYGNEDLEHLEEHGIVRVDRLDRAWDGGFGWGLCQEASAEADRARPLLDPNYPGRVSPDMDNDDILKDDSRAYAAAIGYLQIALNEANEGFIEHAIASRALAAVHYLAEEAGIEHDAIAPLIEQVRDVFREDIKKKGTEMLVEDRT